MSQQPWPDPLKPDPFASQPYKPDPFAAQLYPPHAPAYNPMPPGTNEPQNVLGIVGLILSLVSLLLTCGILSPIALIVSTIGMFQKPRGTAVAGLVLSLVGCLFFVGLVGLFWLGTELVPSPDGKNIHFRPNGTFTDFDKVNENFERLKSDYENELKEVNSIPFPPEPEYRLQPMPPTKYEFYEPKK